MLFWILFVKIIKFCRNLRQLCEQRGFEDADMGPDEHEVVMSDTEIQAAQNRENNRLRAQINKLKNDLAAIRVKVCLNLLMNY